jgi:hypothetical protein
LTPHCKRRKFACRAFPVSHWSEPHQTFLPPRDILYPSSLPFGLEHSPLPRGSIVSFFSQDHRSSRTRDGGIFGSSFPPSHNRLFRGGGFLSRRDVPETLNTYGKPTMKVFESKCTFEYSWEEVSTANWRKYCPWNEKSTHVIATDTLSRTVDPETGIVGPHTHNSSCVIQFPNYA